MSLGILSRCLKNLKPSKICSEIARSYGLAYPVLMGFIEHLTYMRNLCAHHSRVWNRKFTKTLKLPKTKPIRLINSINRDPSQCRRIYNTIVMLMHFLDIISPEHHTRHRLADLLGKYSIDVSAMGFPFDWKTKSIWQL